MRRIVPTDAILIPPQAKQVFSGQIFDVYQWPQKLFDGTEATFEMLRRPDTVEILAIKDGKLVMIHEQQPHRGYRLTFPGGRVDAADESWLAAAQRELLEETGMSFASWKLVLVTQPQPKIEWFGVTFVAWDYVSQLSSRPDAGEQITIEPLSLAAVQAAVGDAANSLVYAREILHKVRSLEELCALPAFEGRLVGS